MYPSSTGILSPESPLFGVRPFRESLLSSQFSLQSQDLLQEMRDLTIWALSSTFLHVSPEQQRPASPTIEMFTLDGSSTSLSNIIYFTSNIFHRALLPHPIPLYSSVNYKAVEVISSCFENTSNDATWVQYPGILLWVSLTVTFAAQNTKIGSILMKELMAISAGAIWWGTEEAMEAIVRFGIVKRRSEGFK